MVLAGLVAALKLVGGTLSDHTFLFLGSGEVSLFGFMILNLSYELVVFWFLKYPGIQN